jgi:surface antigen
VATLLLACVGFSTAVPASASPRDSYPWANAPQGQLDPYGFTTRQCTSYVAWRLHQAGDTYFEDDMRSASGQEVVWGDADHWAVAARQLGFQVSKTPIVGSVAQWNSDESSRYKNYTITASSSGHVAYVVAVHQDGSVTVAQYDFRSPRTYSTMRLRAPRYLYINAMG